MGWIESHHQKSVTPEEAVRAIQSGNRIYIHPGCAEPETLVRAMINRADELENVEIIHLLTLGTADYVEPGMEKHFRHRSFFTGRNVRDAVNQGRADFVPIFLGEIPRLFTRRELPIDAALIHVSPPDRHGFCSLGVSIECTLPAIHSARTVIAQINPKMPRTLGDSFVHIDKINHCINVNTDILELPRVRMSDLHKNIGQHVAELIDDGSTIQMGIGGIPDAVLYFLRDKRNLGIHTEMFSDGVIRLVEQGVINNELKTLHPGKIITSFVLGSRRLYDFIDNNPICEFHPSHYVNDPFIIAQNKKMISINSAIEVDLTGQICADSMGFSNYSGIGGQVDFVRGSVRSEEGKAIIALPSTARKGSITRIVPHLRQGAGVTTSRGDVQYVVTEFGTAYLHGKSFRERAKALINIAHPDYRDKLTAYAKKLHYI